MEQPPTRAFPALPLLWLLTGLAMLVIGLWVGLTRFEPVLNGHPVSLVITFGCVLVGLVAVVLSAVALANRIRDRRDRPAASTGNRSRSRGRRWGLATLTTLGLVVCLAAAGLVGWSRPFGATDRALAALRSDDAVKVTERLTSYDLVPNRRDKNAELIRPTTGLVFYPGARVEARAYAAQLRPLATAGYLVVVLKEPFGVALLDGKQAESIPDLHPEISHWAVGGHSLGGVAAASVADDDRRFAALVLYASQPASKLDRVNLKGLCVSASDDGLQTPAKVAASKALLPETTTYVQIDGSVHAYFGDYGAQPGDGTPTIDRETAQAATVQATAALLASLTPPVKQKR